MSYKIFLSHSSADKNFAKSIYDNAKNIGFDVYLYEQDLQPGTLVAEKVKRNIQDSDAFVVLITPNSESSAYVQQEIGCAVDADKPVIPLVQPDTQKRSLAMLEGIEYIPLDLNNPNDALSKLLGSLKKLKEARTTGSKACKEHKEEEFNKEEKELLIAAATKSGEFLDISNIDQLPGPAILVRFKPNLYDNNDPMIVAKYFDAFKSLLRRGYILYDEGKLYKLTGSGWEKGKELASN